MIIRSAGEIRSAGWGRTEKFVVRVREHRSGWGSIRDQIGRQTPAGRGASGGRRRKIKTPPGRMPRGGESRQAILLQFSELRRTVVSGTTANGSFSVGAAGHLSAYFLAVSTSLDALNHDLGRLPLARRCTVAAGVGTCLMRVFRHRAVTCHECGR